MRFIGVHRQLSDGRVADARASAMCSPLTVQMERVLSRAARPVQTVATVLASRSTSPRRNDSVHIRAAINIEVKGYFLATILCTRVRFTPSE